MKLISIISFLLYVQICLAQSETAQEVNVIDVREIVGIWAMRGGSFTPFQSDLAQGLGSSGSKSNRIPSNPPMMSQLVIDSFGNFTNANYANAKWKIVDHYLIVTTAYGKEIRGFLSADSTTHNYRLTFEGQVFTREKKIDLDPEKK